MARGNLSNDAALHHFLGNLASRPMGDGTFFGLLARQRDHLAELLCRNLIPSCEPRYNFAFASLADVASRKFYLRLQLRLSGDGGQHPQVESAL